MKNLLRSFIIFMILLSLTTYIIYIDSTSLALTRLQLVKHEIIDINIPASMDGLTFIYLSDIHAYTLDDTYYEEVFAKINQLQPDFIFIGGDLLDQSASNLEDERVLKMIQWLQKLEAPLGKFAVLGDDDRLREKTVSAIYAQSNFELLENKVINLHNKSADYIQLIGVLPELTQLNTVLESINLSKFNLVLSYNPTIFKEWKNLDIELFLGAKTHGGQVNFPLYGSLFDQADGMYRKGQYRENNSLLIVSNGIGVSTLRARWLTHPTLYHFTLRTK